MSYGFWCRGNTGYRRLWPVRHTTFPGQADGAVLRVRRLRQAVRPQPGARLEEALLATGFPPDLRGDMLSLLQLTTELSMRAKGDLMLREAGVEAAPDPELDGLFAELRYLEKSIGPTGMLAVRPLLSQTPRDLWEMHRLGQGQR